MALSYTSPHRFGLTAVDADTTGEGAA